MGAAWERGADGQPVPCRAGHHGPTLTYGQLYGRVSLSKRLPVAPSVGVGEPQDRRANAGHRGRERLWAYGFEPLLVLEPLNARAVDWTRRHKEAPIAEVIVDPDLVRHVGRVSGVIDASLLCLPGELEGHWPHYDDVRRLAAVQKPVAAMGPRAFALRNRAASSGGKRAH